MSIRKTGTKHEPEDKDRYVMCVEGLPKKGKTHLGFTAPEPIFLFNLDRGEEGVIDKFDKEIYYEDYIIPSNATDEKKRDTLDRFLKDYFSTIHSEKEGTVMIDSFTQVWDLVYSTELENVLENSNRDEKKVYPFDYADANSVAEHIVKEIYNTDLSLYITQRLQKKYDRHGNVIPNEYKPKGYKGMPYLVQVYGRLLIQNNQRILKIQHNRFMDAVKNEKQDVRNPTFGRVGDIAKRIATKKEESK